MDIFILILPPPLINVLENVRAAKKEEEEGNNEVDWSGGESEAVTVVADLALWHGRAVSLQELSLAARTSIRTFAYVRQPYSTHVASILSMH